MIARNSFLCTGLFPVLRRRLPLLLLEKSGKIHGVIIAHGPGDIAYGKGGLPQERAGPPDAAVQQIFLRRGSGDVLEQPVQIGALNAQIVRNHLDVHGVGIIIFNITEGFLHV